MVISALYICHHQLDTSLTVAFAGIKDLSTIWWNHRPIRLVDRDSLASQPIPIIHRNSGISAIGGIIWGGKNQECILINTNQGSQMHSSSEQCWSHPWLLILYCNYQKPDTRKPPDWASCHTHKMIPFVWGWLLGLDFPDRRWSILREMYCPQYLENLLTPPPEVRMRRCNPQNDQPRKSRTNNLYIKCNHLAVTLPGDLQY